MGYGVDSMGEQKVGGFDAEKSNVFLLPLQNSHYPFKTPGDVKTREVSAQGMPFRYKKQGDREESPESSFSIFSPHDLPGERPKDIVRNASRPDSARGLDRPTPSCAHQRFGGAHESWVKDPRNPHSPKSGKGGDSARWHTTE